MGLGEHLNLQIYMKKKTQSLMVNFVLFGYFCAKSMHIELY